jgi:GT2 family glycosyltransferase
MQEYPLISVIVIAYNSSRYVLEALDSVAGQHYPKLELIITDDHSTDNTVPICQDWVEANRERFPSVQILTSGINTGIAGNANRALGVATGEWIKILAADDLLYPSCLEDFMQFVLKSPSNSVVFSRMALIDEKGEAKGEYLYPSTFFQYSSIKQLKYLLHRNCLPAPSALIRASDIRELGMFDEAYPMMEDLPLWIKMLEHGKQLAGLDKITVCYRRHQSLAYPIIGPRNERYQQTIEDFDRQVRRPLARRLSVFLWLTVWVDLLVDYIVQRPLLYRFLLPALWIWARTSPFRIPMKKKVQMS